LPLLCGAGDMTYTPENHHRRSIRLKGYDYTKNGAYFVTVCTQNRESLFGGIENDEMRLNDAGQVTRQCWQDIPAHFPHVLLDIFVIMPNHIHGILVIADALVGAKNFSPLRSTPKPSGTSKTIGSMIRGFKIGVTKWMRENTPVQHVWQRNYYEHIIRDDADLTAIRTYIADNPRQWEMDQENPDSVNYRPTCQL
jgi:putative transposase